MQHRPLMTGCMMYLVLLAGMFLLSGSFLVQLLACAVPISLLTVGAIIGSGHHRIPFSKQIPPPRTCIALMLPFLLAYLGAMFAMHDYRCLQAEEERYVTVVGTVEQVYYATDSGASFLLDLNTVDGKTNRGKIRVESNADAYYAGEGQRIRCTVCIGEASLRDEYLENRMYAFSDGIYAYAAVSENIEVLETAVTFRSVCERIASECRRRLYQFLPEDAAKLSISILLGDKSVLSAALKRDFRRIGISHILAVSGLHISILCSGLLAVLTHARISRRMRYVTVLVTVMMYMGVTGFSPSVMRAGLMWMIACIADLIRTRPDPLTSLFFSTALICAAAPTAVFDVGLMLSVSATLGLILMTKPLGRFLRSLPVLGGQNMRPLRSFIELLAVNVSATMFTLPVTLIVFGELSILSPIANLLLHIPVTVMLCASPVLLLLSLLPQVTPIAVLCHFLGGAIAGDAALITQITSTLSELPDALIGVRYVFVWVLLALFILCAGVLLWKKKNVLWLYPAFTVFMLVLLLSVRVYAWSVRGDVVLTYSVHKKNDIVSVITDGRGVLIDASDGSYRNAERAWEQLSEQNITELDVYLLTHYHNKHAYALQKLSQTAVIRAVVLPIPLTEDEAQICTVLSSIAENAGITVQMYARGDDDIVIGSAVLSIFSKEMLPRSVQPLLGWSLRAASDSIVYLGGAASEADAASAYASQRDRALNGASYLFLGVHGPLSKAPAALTDGQSGTLRAVIAANEEVHGMIGTLLPDVTVPIYIAAHDGVLRIRLSAS